MWPAQDSAQRRSSMNAFPPPFCLCLPPSWKNWPWMEAAQESSCRQGLTIVTLPRSNPLEWDVPSEHPVYSITNGQHTLSLGSGRLLGNAAKMGEGKWVVLISVPGEPREGERIPHIHVSTAHQGKGAWPESNSLPSWEAGVSSWRAVTHQTATARYKYPLRHPTPSALILY